MITMRTIFTDRAALVATVILVGQSVFYYTGTTKETIPTIAPWNQFPQVVEDWKAVTEIPLGQDVLDTLKPDDYLIRNYTTQSGETVNLFIGYFNSRRNGRAPHSPQWCLPGAGWKSVSSEVVSIPLQGSSKTLPANEYLIEKGINKQLVLYWYHQGARTVANEVVAQVYALPDLIFHGRTDTALVRIMAPVPANDVDAAKGLAVKFAQEAYPLIYRHIL